MNGDLALAEQLAEQMAQQAVSESVEVVVFPPAVYLSAAAEKAVNFSVGGQNAHAAQSGAFTGELSMAMLKAAGASHVLIGHSERRSLFGETDQQVAEKTLAAIAAGLTPVVCVGETLAEREAGKLEAVVKQQVTSALAGVEKGQSVVIAYEPVWAIGTGVTATPEQAQQVHSEIRNWLEQLDNIDASTTPVLYGGSMNAANAEALLAQQDIDGGLIGGASLKVDDFMSIYRCATAN